MMPPPVIPSPMLQALFDRTTQFEQLNAQTEATTAYQRLLSQYQMLDDSAAADWALAATFPSTVQVRHSRCIVVIQRLQRAVAVKLFAPVPGMQATVHKYIQRMVSAAAVHLATTNWSHRWLLSGGSLTASKTLYSCR